MHTATNNVAELTKPEAVTASGGSSRGASLVKVLLIEDNPGDAGLIQLMLSEAGGDLFEVQIVDRLAKGFDALSQVAFGIVLLDLSLPDSQGLDTFVQLHARAPRLPIIVLSGLRDTSIAVEAVHEGAQDFLIKGQVDGQLLVRAMRYAIERKRLTEQLGRYAEELRSKNAQLEADFNMAREIQQIFLPNHYPAVPKRVSPEESALRFSHRYLPAAAVGGDFFNIFPVSDTSAGVFLCDVMGHGMRAALITAVMRGLLEELMPVADDPGRFLAEVNRSLRAILRRTREPFLATAFYMVADVTKTQLCYSSAGHPSPVRLNGAKGQVGLLRDWDGRHGPALGLFEKPEYPTCLHPLETDDLFLLFTDGIYEAENPDSEEFGQKRFLASIRRHRELAPPNLLDALIKEVQSFSQKNEFEDDVCLVAAEVKQVFLSPPEPPVQVATVLA